MALFRDLANLVIDGPPAYERAVAELLDKVWDTWSGWTVLMSVVEGGKPIRIVPPSAAADSVTRERKRFRLFHFLRGPSMRSGSGIPHSSEVAPVALSRGEETVRPYLPPVLAEHREPDDALVHELVHALRRTQDLATRSPTLTEGYGDREEYFAILVENTYASEKGVTIFRRHGLGGAGPGDQAMTSETFLGKGRRRLLLEQMENRHLVGKFVRQHPGLSRCLATQVDTAFNPVGEFVRNDAEYPEHSPDPSRYQVWSV
jgi:hypothetical protein